jgi:hypothetical protein
MLLSSRAGQMVRDLVVSSGCGRSNFVPFRFSIGAGCARVRAEGPAVPHGLDGLNTL